MNVGQKTVDRQKEIYKVTLLGGAVNVVLLVFKFVAGILGHSAAMVADAIHSLSDFITDLIVLVFVYISGKPQDKTHDYGHGKYETLALVFIGLALLAVAVGIFTSGTQKIISWYNGEQLAAPAIHKARQLESTSMEANAWHHRSDALSSIGTAVGIGGAVLLGKRWTVLDPLASLVVGAFIVKVSFDLINKGMSELMEKSLPDEVEDEIMRIAASEPDVIEPHDLKTRRIGNRYAIELHILMSGDITLAKAHEHADSIEKQLKEKYGENTHVAIHMEPKETESPT